MTEFLPRRRRIVLTDIGDVAAEQPEDVQRFARRTGRFTGMEVSDGADPGRVPTMHAVLDHDGRELLEGWVVADFGDLAYVLELERHGRGDWRLAPKERGRWTRGDLGLDVMLPVQHAEPLAWIEAPELSKAQRLKVRIDVLRRRLPHILEDAPAELREELHRLGLRSLGSARGQAAEVPVAEARRLHDEDGMCWADVAERLGFAERSLHRARRRDAGRPPQADLT